MRLKFEVCLVFYDSTSREFAKVQRKGLCMNLHINSSVVHFQTSILTQFIYGHSLKNRNVNCGLRDFGIGGSEFLNSNKKLHTLL